MLMRRSFLQILVIVAVAFLLPDSAFAQKLPPVYLNHLYLVLDEQTYRDISDSDFMRNEFANFEERTTVANAGVKWTGGYFYGEQTYIELFIAGQNPQFKSGESGIGFGVEQPGASEIFYKRLTDKFPAAAAVQKELRTKKISDRNVPWFYDVGVDSKDENALFFAWLMEYHQDYLKTFYADLKPEEDGITRAKYQARRFKADRLFKNIREATVALDETESGRFIKELEAFDFKIEKKKSQTIAIGKDVKFFIVPSAKTSGIVKLKITLQREKQGQKVYHFGTKSILNFKGKTAIWIF